MVDVEYFLIVGAVVSAVVSTIAVAVDSWRTRASLRSAQASEALSPSLRAGTPQAARAQVDSEMADAA